ncbi:MAG: DUF58 domain-containing protein [Myxococcales bacterium]|nr:DUF58 domain-containing protein [Myxococcales bacterium]
MTTATELLRAATEVVAALPNAAVGHRHAIDGRVGGLHRGMRRGGGVEFAEHRDYAPGDDLRRLDWRAYARNDRLSVKRFEQEVHGQTTVIIDSSASMALAEGSGAGPVVDKWAQVQVLAAAIALMVGRQRDELALTVADKPDHSVRPGPGQVERVMASLATLSPEGARGLLALDITRPIRGLVIVLSDLLADPSAAIAPLATLRRAGAQVVLLQTLHPLELRFGFKDVIALSCAEVGTRTTVEPRAIRQRYLTMMRAHCDAVAEACAAGGVHYDAVDLGESLTPVVGRWLAGRGLR